jgi:hypothetical protein
MTAKELSSIPEFIFSALFFFRFEYIFRLNIQSVKDCDPTKFSKEMGPHYVSCIIIKVELFLCHARSRVEVKLHISISSL